MHNKTVQELEEKVDDLELRYLRLKEQRSMLRPLAIHEHIIGWTILLTFMAAILAIGFYIGTTWKNNHINPTHQAPTPAPPSPDKTSGPAQ